MENAIEIFNSDNLIIRAVDNPTLTREDGKVLYDCSTIAQEFEMMMSDSGMNSVSSTLLIPGEHVSTYKAIGYLIDARKADCFHICKSDSGSSGNVTDGDFKANQADFDTVSELAEYIKNTKDHRMNEINLNLTIDGVIGLVFNESINYIRNLQAVIIFQSALFKLTNTYYPIYMYSKEKGTLQIIELTEEEKYQIMNQNNHYNITDYGYYLESSDDFYKGEIFSENTNNKTYR